MSEDQTRAVGMLMQKLVVPNTQYHSYQAKGLKPDARYHFYNRSLKYNIKDFGDLVTGTHQAGFAGAGSDRQI